MEPETVATGAGFRLDRWLRDHFYAGRIDDWMPMILAIEAEARAAAVAPVLEALREKVEAIPGMVGTFDGGEPFDSGFIRKADVLALLSAPSPVREPDALDEPLAPTPALRPVREPEGLDVDRLARQFHEMLKAFRYPGCGWQFASEVEDGSPLCPCPGVAAKYVARLAATPERPADEAGT